MIDFDEALRLILGTGRRLEEETVDLHFALGRVVAQSIVADDDAVPFARSAMDGYAVRAAECARATHAHPIALLVAGLILAEEGESTLISGTALAITTGAPLPAGADAIIPHEKTERYGDMVRIFAPVTVGSSVFAPAEDICSGDELLGAGETIRPRMLALLAFAGKAKLSVIKRPRVAILCTGNELVDPSATPGHGQIRNSNAIGLSALTVDMGGEPCDHGVAPDIPSVLAGMLNAARNQADLLITCGGASQGEHDLVKPALLELGAQFLFKNVAIRPGKPFGFARWGDLPVCVLPGNPAAAFVCFQQFVRPLLTKLAGNRMTGLPTVLAKLDGELHGRAGRRYFVLSRLKMTPEGFVVTPLVNQCSALVRTTADANSMVTVRETSEPAFALRPGGFVDVEVLDWRSVFGGER